MLHDIVAVRPLGRYRLHLLFDDGVEGDVDVSELVHFEGVFASLRDEEEFARVEVDPETGTICWPSGADLDPVVLYARVTDTSVKEVLATEEELVR